MTLTRLLSEGTRMALLAAATLVPAMTSVAQDVKRSSQARPRSPYPICRDRKGAFGGRAQ